MRKNSLRKAQIFGLMFQFMHDHDDLQWASHGPSMSCSQNVCQNMVRAATGDYTCITLTITYVFTQIISENTCHRHTIDFHHGHRGIGPYFRQAEEGGRCLPANHVIWWMHTQFSSAEKSKLFIVLRIKHITCPAVQTTEHGGWRVRTDRIAKDPLLKKLLVNSTPQ